MSEFTEAGEEQRLAAKYSSFFKLLEKLSDRDIEDVYWVIKRKVEESRYWNPDIYHIHKIDKKPPVV